MEVFDRAAAEYDAWYDTPLGQVTFAEEVAALRPIVQDLPRPWLEVGVGSGRFAEAFNVTVGLDPARGPLRLAAKRGVHVVQGVGEALPFPDGRFGAALLVVTLCFVTDPTVVLREVRRVLRPEGGVVLGLVFAEGPWGQHYQRLAAHGDEFYRQARFYTRTELRALLTGSGLSAVRWWSALHWPPDGPLRDEGPQAGDDADAGFTAILATTEREPVNRPGWQQRAAEQNEDEEGSP